MWIVIRFLIALGVFLYKLLFRRTPKDFPLTYKGTTYHYNATKSKSGKILRHYIETPLASPFVACFVLEGRFERWCKFIGFGDELSIGNENFDRQIYIIGDNPAIAQYIGQKKVLQLLISNLIGDMVKSISITGETLRLEIAPDIAEQQVLPQFVGLLEKFKDVSRIVKSRFQDTFYIRALIAEAITWSIVGYAISTFVEWRFYREDYHLYPTTLILPGLLVAAFLAFFAIFLLCLFLGSSSRGPRVIVDSYILLLFSLPIAGIELISDINRGLDNKEPTVITRQVTNVEKRAHRGRRGSTYYTYHVYFDDASSPRFANLNLPNSMSVSSEDFRTASRTQQITLSIGSGFLGFPWYKEVK